MCAFGLVLDEGVEEYLLVDADSGASTVARLIQHSSTVHLDENADDLVSENCGS